MRCKYCEISLVPSALDFRVEERDEADEVEISFVCPGCHREFFAVLGYEDFNEV